MYKRQALFGFWGEEIEISDDFGPGPAFAMLESNDATCFDEVSESPSPGNNGTNGASGNIAGTSRKRRLRRKRQEWKTSSTDDYPGFNHVFSL